MTIGIAILGIALALLIIAALCDIVWMEIPDTISILLGFATAGVAWFAASPDLLSRFVALAVMAVLGVVMFARGWMGGGDVKLLVAIAPLTGIEALPERLGAIAVAGGVLALVMLMVKAIVGAAAPDAALPLVLRRDAPLPYAVAIAAGMMVWAIRSNTLPATAWF